MTESERVAEYQRLLASGLSDAEARGTVWPSEAPLDLDAIDARAAAATPGPWHADSIANGVRHLERNCDWYAEHCPDDHHLPGRQGGDGGQRDGEFIASARIDVPSLVAEVRRLRALLGEARDHIAHYAPTVPATDDTDTWTCTVKTNPFLLRIDAALRGEP